MSRNARLFVIAFSAISTLVLAHAAKAVTVPLTGGDSTDGWAVPAGPPGGLVLAYDIDSSSDTTIQSVVFHAWPGDPSPAFVPGGVTVTSTGLFFDQSGNGTPSFASPTTDDNAMASMLHTQSFNPFNVAIDITVTGLATGNYRVDQFFYADDGGGLPTYQVNGGTPDAATSATGPYFNSQIVAVTAGQIVIHDVNPSTVVQRLNGLAITQLPEPGSMSLLALGGVALLRRVRRAAK